MYYIVYHIQLYLIISKQVNYIITSFIFIILIINQNLRVLRIKFISREQYYLDLLKPEYNILKIAGSRLGSIQSEATNIKISIAHKGKNNHFYAKTHTYETRKKIGLSLKSIIRVNNNKPRVVTLKTKLSMSLRCKGVCKSF